MRLTSRLLTTAALSTALATTALGDATGITAEFKGGSATAYIEMLGEHDDTLNVLVNQGVSAVHLEPVKLRNVDLKAALYVLDGISGEYQGEPVTLSVSNMGAPPNQGNSMYRVLAQQTPQAPMGRRSTTSRSTPEAGLNSQVWSLESVNQRGTASKDVLAAIEAALELHEDAAASATVRFHADSNLLLVRAKHDQITLIDSVIAAFHSMPTKRTSSGDRIKELQAEVNALNEKLEDADVNVHQTVSRVERERERATQLEVQNMGLQDQITSLQNKCDRLEARLLDLIERHAHEKATLEAKIRRLETMLERGAGGGDA